MTVAAGVLGAVVSRLGGADPYGEIGGGELALDVSDHVPPPALDSPEGQAEVEQLENAIDDLRGRRRLEP